MATSLVSGSNGIIINGKFTGRNKVSSTDKEKWIKSTSVTGKVGKISQIGRLWHRMYPPRVRLITKNPKDKPKLESTSRFIELLTFFPDSSSASNDFLEFLSTNPEGFEQLWGDK